MSVLLLVHTITSFFGSLPISKAIALFFVAYAFLMIIINQFRIKMPFTLVLIYSVFVLFSNILNYRSPYDFFISVIESLWWPSVFTLYYYKIKDEKGCRIVLGTFNILFLVNLVNVACFARNRFLLMGEITSFNYIYYLICVVPFVAFIKSSQKKILLLLVVSFVVVISAKRTSLIIVLAQFLISLFFVFKNARNKILAVVVVVFVAFFSSWGLQRFENAAGYNAFSRFEQIQDDGGSGRLYIWMQVWDSYSRLSLPEKLIGRGHNAVRMNSSVHGLYFGEDQISAHNDFLEILYDFGLLTLIIYILIIISIIKLTVSLGRSDSHQFFELMLQTVATILIMSMTSHLVLYPSYFSYLIIAWTIANYHKTSIQKRKRISDGK